MDQLETLRSLRAVRHFTDSPVPDHVLDAVLDAARWTGSARNRQPWRVALITLPDERARLAGLGAYAGVLAAAPLVALLAMDQDLGGQDGEFDAGRFAQTFMLAAHLSGLGTCPVSFFPAENARTATTLAGLSSPWSVRSAIAVGYPAPQNAAIGRSAVPTGRMPLSTLIVSRSVRVT